MTLNEYLKQAKEGHYAIGHFNFSTEDVLKAVVSAAKESGAPCVLVGTSEGESGYIGIPEAVALVRAVAKDYDYPVFLNADHFKTFEKCKAAIDAGYDSIIIDASKLPNDQNMALTKQVVDYASSVNPDISIEGELGYMKGASEVEKKIEISPADYSKPEEVAEFVSQTGVDRMAVVFGNIHGIVTEQEEKLDIPHFQKIVAAAPSPAYVLHGASGISDDDVRAAIRAGIANVHFNTELRVAYHDEIKKQFAENPEQTTPYKYLQPAADEVKKLVAHKLEVFRG
ncbi:MAG TPA: class II fructose-bisphosphate aldolase [Candidatus Paceibacterota bacterium]|nr:class II fructose-bisphosphate aldolase [Candidatus Paceibacterota bacterium]